MRNVVYLTTGITSMIRGDHLELDLTAIKLIRIWILNLTIGGKNGLGRKEEAKKKRYIWVLTLIVYMLLYQWN